jgi:pyruvate/2-oxoglutarate dehydrogenase complex dihydrolipoamide dehydrogenase (E3) component
MPEKFDAIVIGTGQSGPALAVRLAKAGRKTAIIERQSFGGTCVNTGCTPTKTLIASARAAYVARRAGDFGITIDGPISVDMARVRARKDAVVQASSGGVAKWLKETPGLTVYEGHARFESPRTVRVNSAVFEAREIFIDTGARARVPDMPGIAEIEYLTNSSMMAVDYVPEHLVIVGGSYIGLEFGQMYRRFGSRVTIVEMGPRVIAKEDEDVSAAIQAILENEGIAIRLNAECLSVTKRDPGVTVNLDCEDAPRKVEGSHVLLAVGRMPNTDDLGLDQAGVKTDEHGYIMVDDELRTNVPEIWALGDVNGRGAFTHTSYNDYEIVAANLLENDRRRVSERIQAYALYIDPPLGRAGMTEQEARKSGRKLLAGKMMMSRVARARERSETDGFMKILVDAETKHILGAAILGIEGDEAIHSILDLMYARAPYTVMQRAMHIHPTVTELIPTLLGDLQPLA